MRVTTQVLPEGALQWGSDEQFTFKMAEDHRSIEGARHKGGQMSRVTMQKMNESDAAHGERWGSLACRFTNDGA